MAATRQDRETRRRIARIKARRGLEQAQAGRRTRDNLFAGAAAALALALALALQVTWFSSNPTPEETRLIEQQAAAAGSSAEPTPGDADEPAPGPSGTPAAAPAEIPDKSLAEGRVFSGTLATSAGDLGVELDGTVAPQAVAVFKSLADSGFFAGKTCHRLTTAETMGILQCGSLNGDGAGQPGYQWGPVENTPADGVYPAGSVAVARAATTDSHGTQFFLVYKDSILPQDAGGYTIMGKLTSGLDVLESVAAQGAVKDGAETADGQPKTPVTIDSFTLK
ncbi:peptidylprolyl isomerase [Arthrobacter sp. ATA002]|uniref:peptidylprolyl isomerase n=1 Tax=Arthrobacter sp. ATA002 TaxID=2991715 RepID=UPI0022A6DFA8|nr:peptidylprolyl isomerase [Arthrobacter sp. ATA002]WAP53085.1 peptidylprolyl isomerase [Arthrobacter sp. ATA002]